MKTIYILIIVSVCLFTDSLSAQKKVSDGALHAQQRRMVYLKWGDWQPKAKYFLGVQTNPRHEMVWGWTAPMYGGNTSKNKKYKKTDIRPLSPQGKQTLRYASLYQQQQLISSMKKESDKIGDLAMQEIAYNSAVLSKTDPLYLLYFKKTLKPIYNFSDADIMKEVKNVEVYKFLNETGLIEEHRKEMLTLKDRYNIAVNSDMERGQRIIFYHKILEDYRSEQYKFLHHVSTTSMYLKYKDKHPDYKASIINPKAFGNWVNRDEQIALEIIAKSKYKF